MAPEGNILHETHDDETPNAYDDDGRLYGLMMALHIRTHTAP
jgi:hypothetical protein